MGRDETNNVPADAEQIAMLEDLLKRARDKGIKTGVHNDELEDMDHAAAADLIDQLRRRLGEERG